MPQDLQKHIRYPEDLFFIQAQIYRTYHMNSAEVFYNREDLWQFPRQPAGGEEATMAPYYIIVRLPGQPQAEFLQMLPMVPSQRQNMIAWLAARSDPPDYGKLLVYQFISQGEARLRPLSDRGADQPEHRDLPAALAVEPDGLARHPRKSAGDPDRELDLVCVPALSARGRMGAALKGTAPARPDHGGAGRNRTRRRRGRSSARGAQPLQRRHATA